jgi:formiminotetrahydrofolate cyclodeaminase
MSAPRYVDESVRSFLVKLAARSPEPAGGSALALAAASAAALLSLCCDPGDPANGDPALRACLERSEELRTQIQELIDADVDAYRRVVHCLGLPQHSPTDQRGRRAALDKALLRAGDVPLQVAEAGLSLLELAIDAIGPVRTSVLGDLAAAIHLAEAAVKGSLRNARINARALSDEPAARDLLSRATVIEGRLEILADRAHQALQGRGSAE